VNVASDLRKDIDNTQRQRGGEKGSSQKASQLGKKADTLNEKLVKIEDAMIGDIFEK
jgi:hypothetical protein